MAAKFTLSDKVAEIVYDDTTVDVGHAIKVARRILSIPEIKDALAAHERLLGKPRVA